MGPRRLFAYILVWAVLGFPAAAPSQQQAAGMVGDPAWGFTFRAPQGWKYQMDSSGVVMGHDSIPGLILVMPHMQTTIQGVESDMASGLHDEGVSLNPSSRITQSGSGVLSAEYAGVMGGEQVRAFGLGTLSPHGGGAYVMAVTTPPMLSEAHRNAARSIAASMTYTKSDTAGLVNHFAGYWWYYSGTSSLSHERIIYFGPDGTFRQKGMDSADVSNYDQYGNVTSQYLGNQAQRGLGRWTVRGDRYKGVFIITRPDGSTYNIQYQVKPSSNQRFRDYLFDGYEYHPVTEAQLRAMGY